MNRFEETNGSRDQDRLIAKMATDVCAKTVNSDVFTA